MRPPCETVVQYVLPVFRCLVAKELVERHKFSQVETADKLGTTQAAISQYFSSRRGEKRMKVVQSVPSIRSAAKKMAKEIATGRTSADEVMANFCSLCLSLRKRGLMCDLHREMTCDEETCEICLQI
jgi:predicted transcriptional regulator